MLDNPTVSAEWFQLLFSVYGNSVTGIGFVTPKLSAFSPLQTPDIQIGTAFSLAQLRVQASIKLGGNTYFKADNGPEHVKFSNLQVADFPKLLVVADAKYQFAVLVGVGKTGNEDRALRIALLVRDLILEAAGA
ncbi:uncharacterized protein SS50377_28829 [Spironucleus salmonicida]|uniref:Uncharacterized protein n=1 Tax=Spironucleus salmonicida TaxID=348837 RepID=V6LQU2_9EUKA|nr:hypothetical protein SS50377_28829 [Spironucleus salmonicida]|eukprot:EST46955.1 Hypothetical protein SS50377_12989 [Spironucleus salmonicida]